MAAGAANDAAKAAKTEVEIVAPWTCFGCFARCADPHRQKCEKCHRKRIMPDKSTDAAKPLISNQVLKTIDSAAEDGGGASQASGTEKKLEELQEEVKKYEGLILTAQESLAAPPCCRRRRRSWKRHNP